PDARLDFALDGQPWDPRLLVRVPAADFGGEIVVDWLDAQGQVVASARYESRDRQFALALLPQAADARVYAMDGRTGFSAFGGVHLLAPVPVVPVVPATTPQAKPVVATNSPVAAASAIAPAPVPPTATHAKRTRGDRIATMNFERAPARREPRNPKPKARR